MRVLLLLTLLGCAETQAPIAFPTWEPSLELTIGSEQDDRYVFQQISGIAHDASGRIYVADAGRGMIRVYSDSGQHIRDIGRPGEGPGEFRGLLGIGFVFDTLYAVDGRAQAVVYFDTVGAYLRSIPVDRIIGGPGMVSRMLPNGRAVVIPSVLMGASGRIPRLLASAKGRQIDTLDYILAGEGSLRLPAGAGQISIRDPFAQPRFLPVHRSGEWWIDVTQYPDPPHGPGQFSLTRRTIAGDTIWSKPFSREPVVLPPASVDQVVDSILQTSRLPVAEVELRAALRPPAYYYAVDRVIVSEAGEIWLRVRSLAGRSWLVLDGDGEQVAGLTLPEHAAPREIVGREWLLAVQTNDLGVETVVRYRLNHRPGSE